MVPSKGMDLVRSRGLLAGLGAGLGLGIALFVLEQFHNRKRLLKDIAQLKEAVINLQNELSSIRRGDKVSGYGDRALRRSRRRASGYETESTMYSAVETDDDDEFYDLSSEEDDLLKVSLRENQANQESEQTQSLFSNVDELMSGSELDQKTALKTLLYNLRSHEGDINYLWRLAKAYRLEATGKEDKEGKKEAIEKGLAYARKAVDMDQAHGDANKWFAILTGMKNDYLPTKEKIENAVLFQKHLEIALLAKPEDYSLYHLLCRFKYEIANMSWIEKKLAASLFGSLPEVTIEDAIADGIKCEELSPNAFPDNRLLLGRCYICQGDYRAAITWLDLAVTDMTDTPQNELLKKEVDPLIKKYSRYRQN